MTTLVFSSDWHGDSITQGVDRYPEVEAGVLESVRHAIDIDADAYLFGGDLCDPHTARCHRTTALAHRAAHKLRDGGIRSFWLTGNHDVVEDGTGAHTLLSMKWGHGYVMDAPGHLVIIGGKQRLNVIALPFTPTSHAYDPGKFINELEIGNDHPTLVLGHLNLQGITAGSETLDMPRGREVFWPIDELKAKFPEAILIGGHYHERQEYKGVRIIGSLARLTYGEGDNQVGYLELEI